MCIQTPCSFTQCACHGVRISTTDCKIYAALPSYDRAVMDDCGTVTMAKDRMKREGTCMFKDGVGCPYTMAGRKKNERGRGWRGFKGPDYYFLERCAAGWLLGMAWDGGVFGKETHGGERVGDGARLTLAFVLNMNLITWFDVQWYPG
ncbi:hypothetical protein WAI453_008096 [Rhynchosporium graminicola]